MVVVRCSWVICVDSVLVDVAVTEPWMPCTIGFEKISDLEARRSSKRTPEVICRCSLIKVQAIGSSQLPALFHRYVSIPAFQLCLLGSCRFGQDLYVRPYVEFPLAIEEGSWLGFEGFVGLQFDKGASYK